MSTQVNYTVARQCAKKLSDIAAGACEKASSQSRKMETAVPTVWRDDAAEAFMAKCYTWSADTQKIGEKVSDLANEILRVTEELEEKERKAAEASRALAVGRSAAQSVSGTKKTTGSVAASVAKAASAKATSQKSIQSTVQSGVKKAVEKAQVAAAAEKLAEKSILSNWIKK